MTLLSKSRAGSDVYEDAVVFGEPPKFSEISRGVQPFPKADFVDPSSTLANTELPGSTRFCVAPRESTGKLKAAESPIRLDQETGLSAHGPSSPQPPPSSLQINNVDMKQAPTALQKVLNDSTTSAQCVDEDDVRSYDKVKEKRESTGTTSNDPSQGRPLKRAGSDCATAQKHEDFYISDANTVIEVDAVLFKLHRSRLVTKSSFFAQLLEHNLNDNFPNDNFPNDDMRVENDGKVTVYHLGNVTTADDLVALLKFDDNPTEYYFQPPPFSVLASILRAATALRFETYRVWAARVLGQTWSSSLADLTPAPMENAAEIIALARSCDVNSGMKRALYELSRTRRIGLHGYDVIGQSGLEQIGHADQKCVELMRELSVTTWSKIAVRIGASSCQKTAVILFSSSASETCPFKNGTQQATWDKRVHDSGLYTKFLFDSVCGAQALINIPWEKAGWCSDCIQSKRATWRDIRENIWSDMDKWIPGHE